MVAHSSAESSPSVAATLAFRIKELSPQSTLLLLLCAERGGLPYPARWTSAPSLQRWHGAARAAAQLTLTCGLTPITFAMSVQGGAPKKDGSGGGSSSGGSGSGGGSVHMTSRPSREVRRIAEVSVAPDTMAARGSRLRRAEERSARKRAADDARLAVDLTQDDDEGEPLTTAPSDAGTHAAGTPPAAQVPPRSLPVTEPVTEPMETETATATVEQPAAEAKKKRTLRGDAEEQDAVERAILQSAPELGQSKVHLGIAYRNHEIRYVVEKTVNLCKVIDRYRQTQVRALLTLSHLPPLTLSLNLPLTPALALALTRTRTPIQEKCGMHCPPGTVFMHEGRVIGDADTPASLGITISALIIGQGPAAMSSSGAAASSSAATAASSSTAMASVQRRAVPRPEPHSWSVQVHDLSVGTRVRCSLPCATCTFTFAVPAASYGMAPQQVRFSKQCTCSNEGSLVGNAGIDDKEALRSLYSRPEHQFLEKEPKQVGDIEIFPWGQLRVVYSMGSPDPQAASASPESDPLARIIRHFDEGQGVSDTTLGLVDSIELIENPELEARFEQARYEMRINLGSDVVQGGEVSELYHLSSAGFGDVCESGLKLEMARPGHLGKGIYFAGVPHKCDSYWFGATRRGTGGVVTAARTGKDPAMTRQMLVCSVLLGRQFEMPPNLSDRTICAAPAGYDSVHGSFKTGAPETYDEYAIYDSARHLPKYLVTYTVPPSNGSNAFIHSIPEASLDSLRKPLAAGIQFAREHPVGDARHAEEPEATSGQAPAH